MSIKKNIMWTAAAALLLTQLAAASAHAQSSVFLDQPRANAVVGRDFHVGGWAIDWAARQTTGVMTIHVWAYPATGASPIFLGTPARGNRSDVAAAFGSNFLRCGFGLNVRGLAPGRYMLAVFPFSDIRGAFDYGSAIGIPIVVASQTSSSPRPAPEREPTRERDDDRTPPPSDGSGGSTSLRVLHWNIHHGVGTDGDYDLDRLARWMARWRPDVISLNEVEKNTGWGDEDQGRRFVELLRAATGRTWYAHFAQRNGDWSSRGQGNLILSRFPFAATGRETLSYDRSVAIATIVVNGRNVTVMSTHLDADSNSRRETQVRQLQSLAGGWAEPRIIAGDFNAWPDHDSIDMMTNRYADSWSVAERAGVAESFRGNSRFGATRRGRIDYIFHSGSSSMLRVRSAEVFDTRDSRGHSASDHKPLLTVYEVR